MFLDEDFLSDERQLFGEIFSDQLDFLQQFFFFLLIDSNAFLWNIFFFSSGLDCISNTY